MSEQIDGVVCCHDLTAVCVVCKTFILNYMYKYYCKLCVTYTNKLKVNNLLLIDISNYFQK